MVLLLGWVTGKRKIIQTNILIHYLNSKTENSLWPFVGDFQTNLMEIPVYFNQKTQHTHGILFKVKKRNVSKYSSF